VRGDGDGDGDRVATCRGSSSVAARAIACEGSVGVLSTLLIEIAVHV
jgi:hypothetical protein